MRRLSVGRSAGSGAFLGLLIGVAYTLITLFQFDRTQFTTGQLLLAGLVVAIPVATIGGFLAGWAWTVLLERRR